MFHTEKSILTFDEQDGLRKLINEISTLPILTYEYGVMNERIKRSQNQIIYTAIYNLKLYFEFHLRIKVRQILTTNVQNPKDSSIIMVHNESSINNYQSNNSSQADVFNNIQLLSNSMSINSHWKPVDELVQLNGLQLLFKIIGCYMDDFFIYDSRGIISIVLEIINICAVSPKVQLLLCKPIFPIVYHDPQAENNVGMDILLKIAKGKFINSETNMKKASLFVIRTCVYAPIYREKGSLNWYSENEAPKEQTKTNDDDVVIRKILACIRDNHGIMILLKLMTKNDLTFDNSEDIRGYACQILAGLARNESVRQIIRKLPLFNGDQLQKYLTNQQTVCGHPVATCPLLNSLGPHKFLNPKPKSGLSTNIAVRFSKNIHSKRENLRLIFSRFNMSYSIIFKESLFEHYSCCKFLKENHIAIGTNKGDIKVINKFTHQEELSFRTKVMEMTNLECSENGTLLISSSRMTPSTYYLYEKYCKFSFDGRKLLGTQGEIAAIYDVETRHKIMKLVPRLSNQYCKNRASFDATSQLVLSDGVLWDTISGKIIHKFDRLNKHINGVFHPNGLEIISNTEVWDVRTFGLLHSVSHLDRCNVMFSKTGNGMYSYAFGEYCTHQNLQTSFKTVDTHDYTNLMTIDVDEHVYDMASGENDYQIAVVGILKSEGRVSSSIKIFDVGICSKTKLEDLM